MRIEVFLVLPISTSFLRASHPSSLSPPRAGRDIHHSALSNPGALLFYRHKDACLMQAHILRMRPVAAAAARKRTLTSAGGTGLIWETGFESATAPCEGRGRRREMRFWFRSAGPALITGCLCHVSLSIGWTPPKMIKRNQTSDIEVLLHSNLFCLFKLLFFYPLFVTVALNLIFFHLCPLNSL